MSDGQHLLNAWVRTRAGDSGRVVAIRRDGSGYLVRVDYINRQGTGWFDPEILPEILPVPPSNVVTSVHPAQYDPVREPSHYKFPGGVEVIDITKHLPFAQGNVIKYVARAGRKDPSKEVEDLEKALTYLEIALDLARSKKESTAA